MLREDTRERKGNKDKRWQGGVEVNMQTTWGAGARANKDWVAESYGCTKARHKRQVIGVFFGSLGFYNSRS